MGLGGQEQGVRGWVPGTPARLGKLARGQAYSVWWVSSSTIGCGSSVSTGSLPQGRPLAPSSLAEKLPAT